MHARIARTADADADSCLIGIIWADEDVHVRDGEVPELTVVAVLRVYAPSIDLVSKVCTVCRRCDAGTGASTVNDEPRITIGA